MNYSKFKAKTEHTLILEAKKHHYDLEPSYGAISNEHLTNVVTAHDFFDNFGEIFGGNGDESSDTITFRRYQGKMVPRKVVARFGDQWMTRTYTYIDLNDLKTTSEVRHALETPKSVKKVWNGYEIETNIGTFLIDGTSVKKVEEK